jgi:hypothetical protein
VSLSKMNLFSSIYGGSTFHINFVFGAGAYGKLREEEDARDGQLAENVRG